MKKTKEYFKWLFSRWYLYILALLWLGYTYEPTFYFRWEIFLGEVIGTILLWTIIISIFVGIKRLIKTR